MFRFVASTSHWPLFHLKMTKPFLKNFQNPVRKEATSQGINSSRYSTQKKKLVFLGEGNDEIRVKFYTVVRVEKKNKKTTIWLISE